MSVIDTILMAVTVYPDRARVTRQGSTLLDAGRHTLEIVGLPAQLDPDSLRVTGRGTSQARLMGVQLKRMYYSEAPVEEVRKLEAQVENVQDEISNLDAQIELVKQQRLSVKALAEHTDKFALALAAGEMELGKHLALMDGLRERATSLDSELLQVSGKKRQTERELQKLQNQLNQLRGARPRQGYSSLVEIEVQQGGDMIVDLSYTVSSAGWEPIYDLRLLEENSNPQLEVSYLAQVTQQTGEDWLAVDLALSTARPALAGVLPELEPEYLKPLPPPEIVSPVSPRAYRAQLNMEFSSAALEDQGSQPLASYAIEEAPAHLQTSGMAVTYRAQGQANIPPDGQPHRVTVSRYPLSCKLDYVTAPKLVQAVYRRARAINDGGFILLPGQANLFVGDEFLGVTRLELTASQGELELILGVDDRIKVERELKRREVDKSIVGGKRRLHFAYEIELENLSGGPASILLHDQIPVSRHEEIKVRLDTASPRSTRQTELNLLDWELNLAPKEKQLVRFEYTVEHPAAMEVAGLDL